MTGRPRSCLVEARGPARLEQALGAPSSIVDPVALALTPSPCPRGVCPPKRKTGNVLGLESNAANRSPMGVKTDISAWITRRARRGAREGTRGAVFYREHRERCGGAPRGVSVVMSLCSTPEGIGDKNASHRAGPSTRQLAVLNARRHRRQERPSMVSRRSRISWCSTPEGIGDKNAANFGVSGFAPTNMSVSEPTRTSHNSDSFTFDASSASGLAPRKSPPNQHQSVSQTTRPMTAQTMNRTPPPKALPD